MKVLGYPIISSLILYSTTAMMKSDSGFTNSEAFKEQKEEVQATFNIDKSQEKGNNNNVQILEDDAPVQVLIKSKNSRGTSIAQTMSLKIDMEIKRAGILGTTITKKDIQYFEQHPDIERIEVDQTLYALGNKERHLRKLAEETPYGIPMVLQDVNFWNSLEEPTGTIKVCVADTGYDRGHVDLPDGNDVTGTSNEEYPSEVWYEDGHGHGSHCSGTVAAIGDNNEGVVGVLPNNASGKFQLVIGNALTGGGSGTGAGVLKAVETCVDNGAKVVSLSLGGGAPSQITEDFYKELYEDKGILFIAAAGNGGSSSLLYPASYPALMSVAAIDSNKNTASFSQYNNQVEISGPGVAIKSTIPNNQYATWSGTSMATPHVAGVAGLLWMHFPECKNYEIRNVLAATAEDLKASGCDMNTGYGLVQAKNAYELLSEGNCGGNIGQTSPVGGCEQLVPVGPTAAPTPQCASDSDCDDGDTCTVNTCDNGLCESLLSCSLCAKSEVKVEITTDNYGAETSFDIKDNSGDNIMEGGDYGSATTYAESTCVGGGSYTFTINDSYGDGICCAYGSGSYSVKVNDEEVASGGEFSGSTEEKQFDVDNMSEPPTTPPPTTASPTTVSPTPAPSSDPTLSPTLTPSSAPSTSTATIVPTSVPTATESSVITFSPTSTESLISFAPTNTASLSDNQPTPLPTPFPTGLPPTLHPTQTQPTLFPTGRQPTPFPTSIPLTPWPTDLPPTSYPTERPPTEYPTHTPPTLYPTHSQPTPFPTNLRPPTFFPTQTPPTLFPTHSPPTPFPTENPPTPYPTHMAPTMYPIQDRLTTSPTTAATDGGACGIKGEACQVAADCCSNKCRRNKKTCKG